jgi:hypothetical protein
MSPPEWRIYHTVSADVNGKAVILFVILKIASSSQNLTGVKKQLTKKFK